MVESPKIVEDIKAEKMYSNNSLSIITSITFSDAT